MVFVRVKHILYLPVFEPLLVGRVQTKHGFHERDDGITWFAH